MSRYLQSSVSSKGYCVDIVNFSQLTFTEKTNAISLENLYFKSWAGGVDIQFDYFL